MIPKVIDQARKLIESPVTPPTNEAVDPSLNTATARARRNFFRATPTAAQAQVVGASPVGDQQFAAKVRQMPVRSTTQSTPPIDPSSSTSGVDYLNSLYTSPEEEMKMRKASVQRQRILAAADALRHIGNIYNTSRYAPVQRFNNPAEVERQRYMEEKKERDANNYKFLTYQQAKAKQDREAAQWNAEFGLKLDDAARKKGYTDAQIKALQDRVKTERDYKAAMSAIQQGRLDEYVRNNTARRKETERHNKRTEGIAGGRLALEREKFNYRKQNGGYGGRSGQPYVYPTQNGYLTMGRDFNDVSRKSLFDQMKKDGVIDATWETRYNNMYEPAQQSALMNTAISNWLLKNPGAVDYMKKHYGAQYYGDAPVYQPTAPAGDSYGYIPQPWSNQQFIPDNEEDIDFDEFLED